jgi:DNA polymerase III alpha subunit (gram-positive type)
MINEKMYGKTIPEILALIDSFKGKTLVFFDTETTGLNPDRIYEQVTQIGAIAVNGDTWSEIETFDQKAKLGANVQKVMNDPAVKDFIAKIKDPKFQVAITKIEKEKTPDGKEKDVKKKYLTQQSVDLIQKIKDPVSREFVKDYVRNVKKYGKHPTPIEDILGFTKYSSGKPEEERVSEKDLLINFEEFVKKFGPNVIMLSHNAGFDMKVIEGRRQRNELPPMKKNKVFDTLRFVQYFLIPLKVALGDKEFLSKIQVKWKDKTTGKEKEIKDSYYAKLGIIAKTMSVDPKNWHDALADVGMMLQILPKIVKMLEANKDIDISKSQGLQAAKTRNIKP